MVILLYDLKGFGYVYIYIIYIYRYMWTSPALTSPYSLPHSGPGSHDQRVADLKAILVPSPSSIDPCLDSKPGFPRESTSAHCSYQVSIAIGMVI